MAESTAQTPAATRPTGTLPAATVPSTAGPATVAATTDTTSSAAPATDSAPGSAAGAPAPSWLTFGSSNDRRSIVVAGPDAHSIVTAWTSPSLDGMVYGQALVAGQRVFVATEGDSVVALSAVDGSVAWSTNLGKPVPKSALPCGNIDLTGITSTAVIDPSGTTIYVVDFVLPGNHELVALDTSNGAIRWRHPIDPPGLSPLVEQQRSALSLVNGRVYVPFGGLFGDCGPYKGSVVSLAADGSGDTSSWIVPTARQGGLWAPSGLSGDTNGNLFAAIGNAASSDPNNFDYGNAVVRLGPDLVLGDYWAPADWAALSDADKDLGSQGPIPLDASHLFVAGKGGIAYVLSSADLGKVGGETSKLQLCSSAFGGAATDGSVVVTGCSDGLAAAMFSADGTLHAAWRDSGAQSGAPVIAGGTVWVTYTNGHMKAIDLNTGAVIADLSVARSLKGFPETTVTPTAVYVTGSTKVTAFAAS